MIGAVQTEREAALFLSGVIPALWSREHLEHCEKAEAWGHERLKDWPSRCGFDDALRDQLLELSSDHRHGLACIGGYVLTPLNLWAVGIGATEQDGFICRQRWLSLHDLGPGNEPELLGIAPSPKQALLIKPPSR
jgi:hypothetical protein